MTALEDVLALAERGWHLFPVDDPSLKRCAAPRTPAHDPDTCTERGKHPCVKWGHQATTDPQQLVAWWAGSSRNVGIACGPSGLVVVDEDALGDLDRLAKSLGEVVPETFTVETGHGRHLYFNANGHPPIPSRARVVDGYAVDVRASGGQYGGYVVGPGSLHATGVTYTVLDGRTPVRLPDWLADVLAGQETPTEPFVDPAVFGPRGLDAVPDAVAVGHRHQTLVSFAASLRARNTPWTEALALMGIAWRQCEQPPDDQYAWPTAEGVLRDIYATKAVHEAYAENPTEDGEAAGRHVALTPASSIQPRRVQWLWEQRLALGTLGLLAGREGLGKSTVEYWIAAQVTRGLLPGELYDVPKSVIVSAAEDSWEHTIVPRLIAAEADLDRVYRVDVVTVEHLHYQITLPRDLAEMEEQALRVDAALVGLDPLISRLSGDLDTHRDADVRKALEPLAAVAIRSRLAVLGLIHHNKSGSTDPLQLVMGSKAFTGVARTVSTIVPDPDDDTDQRRLFGTPKNNLGRNDLPLLGFTIVSHPVETIDGTAWTGRVEWGEESTENIHEAMRRANEPDDVRTAATEAADWLSDYLEANGGAVLSADAKKAGRAAGHSDPALKKARARLRLRVTSQGFPRVTIWDDPRLTDPP